MEEQISKENSEQNERITRLETVCENFQKFMDNHFPHFKDSVERKFIGLYILVITGILIPILLYIVQK